MVHAKLSLASCLLLLTLTHAASASQLATLKVRLTPERLDARTTIIFTIHVIPQGQPVPSPLLAVSILYPKNIGLITSGLGLETCAPGQLEQLGRCPPDSLMGYGQALVELPFGPEIITEHARITTWMAPLEDEHLALLFYAEGQTPVSAESIFTAQLLEAPSPYGGQLATKVPLIPSLPEAPDASVVDMTSTIGPMNVTYYAWYKGNRIPYHPNGLRLPERCPHGGFPFAATFTFQDGTHTRAQTRVPCPTTTRPANHSATSATKRPSGV